MNRGARAVVSVLAVLVAAFCPAQYVHTNGTELLDGSGRPLHLHGTNLGCWLYFEPWMVGAGVFPNWLAASGTSDEFQQAVVQLVGEEGAERFWNAYRANAVTEGDIAAIARLGFNCVRVPIDYRLFYTASSGAYPSQTFKYIDALLGWCAKYRVYAIIDMHTVPGGQNIENPGSVYADPGEQTVLRNIWTRVGARYAKNIWLAGYDLVNEPVVNGSSDLVQLYQRLTTAIRSVDTHHTLFVEGDWYASQLWLLGSPWDSNMAYSDHNYGSSLPNLLPQHEDQATQYDAPLWMGEFGYNSNTWNAQQESYLNQVETINGRSIQANWTMWAWKAMSIWSAENVRPTTAYQTLLNYWNGTGPAPSAPVAMAGVMDLAEAVRFENCKENRDVVDGYTRPDFLSSSKPFLGQTVPGRIECVNYDMGPEGIAYSNDVWENTGGMGSGFELWNNGWLYRNDGVDITAASGDTSTGCAVGWTDSGQWMNYTVQCQPGTYDLTICYSGPGGDLHVCVNGTNVSGTISLPQGPNGGAWWSYGTYTFPGLVIGASGTAVVQIYEETGGYNLDWLQFDPSL